MARRVVDQLAALEATLEKKEYVEFVDETGVWLTLADYWMLSSETVERIVRDPFRRRGSP